MRFWDTSNPERPTGVKDPQAILDYPIDFSEWLAEMGDSHASHTITTTGGLTVVASGAANGVITPLLSGGTLGETASFTVHIVTAGGREDERTFYLRIQER